MASAGDPHALGELLRSRRERLTQKLRHPRLGPIEYSHVVLQVADNPDHVIVTYSLVGQP